MRQLSPTTEQQAWLDVIAYYGETDLLYDKIDMAVIDSLSDDQQTRAKNALNERISVVPRAKGMYWVLSYSDDDNPNKYSINYGVSACTCSDFMYNCDPNKGLVCKHIWRVRFLLSQNCLPEQEENPYNWLLLRLQEDIQYYKNNQHTEIQARAERLLNTLSSKNSRIIDYAWAFRKRSELLAFALNYDVNKYEDTPKTALEDGKESLFKR